LSIACDAEKQNKHRYSEIIRENIPIDLCNNLASSSHENSRLREMEEVIPT